MEKFCDFFYFKTFQPIYNLDLRSCGQLLSLLIYFHTHRTIRKLDFDKAIDEISNLVSPRVFKIEHYFFSIDSLSKNIHICLINLGKYKKSYSYSKTLNSYFFFKGLVRIF